MACGNCKNCGDSSKGASQRSLVAYIQPCGASPTNSALNAMVDGNYGSAIKVTGGTRQIRGQRTAKYKRLSNGNPTLCYYTQGSPAENTLSVEFADCDCGGYAPDELAAEGSFDLYQLQACCGTADMSGGWSRMHVTRCITMNSLAFGDEASYDPDDDGDLLRTYDANYTEDYYISPLVLNEIVAATGLDAGARINGFVFYSASNSCSENCKDDCNGNWYAITNEGTVIYRRGSSKSIESVTVPGFVASNNAQIGIVGSLLVVIGNAAYYTATIDTYGIPGTFTTHAVTPGLLADGVFLTDEYLFVFGNAGTVNGARLHKIDKNGNMTTAYTDAVANTSVTGYSECGSVNLAVGTSLCMTGSTCGTLSAVPVSPTTDAMTACEVRPGGELWVGTGTGKVFYSQDAGNTWTQVTFPATATNIRDIKWVDAGVGYILDTGKLFTTENGGETWAVSGNAGRVEAITGQAAFLSLAIPCCTNKGKTVNNLAIMGIATGAIGGIWQSTIDPCN